MATRMKFSTPMLQAILRGRKTTARQLLTSENSICTLAWDELDLCNARRTDIATILRVPMMNGRKVYEDVISRYLSGHVFWSQNGSLPKSDAVAYLKVKSVDAVRLRDITIEALELEGFSSRGEFESCWARAHSRTILQENPWVWLYEFAVLPIGKY